MSIIGSNVIAGASGQATGYNLNNSLRFRGSNSANLQRTPASATNRTTWTWSAWVKRGTLGTTQGLFNGNYDGNDNSTCLMFDGGDNLIFFNRLLTVANGNIYTTQVFRDTSAWYHIVAAIDTTQATAANRYKLYINGTQVTSFQIATYPTQNTTMYINSNVQHNIGFRRDGATNYYFDGYMAEVNFIDGSQLTPSSFGETSTTTGSWVPKAYTGTYGTNGFYLKFSDIAQTVSSNVGLGKDFSGNANYWVTNNISTTAGVTYDAMLDVPTNTSATVANYCTMNPLSTTSTLANGNLTYSSGATYCQGTQFPTSGLFYAEVVASGTFGTHGFAWGVIGATANMATTAQPGVTNPTGAYQVYSGGGALSVWSNTSSTNQTNPFTIGQTWQIALDVTTGYMYLGQNNTWYSPTMATTGDPSTGANPTFTLSTLSTSGGFSVLCGNYAAGGTFAWNFGQRPFTYTPPTGFVAMNTFNLPTPTILQGNKYMDATLYTGTGSALTVTNAGAFKPDMVWIGPRSTGNDKGITDSVRGVTKQLYTDLTNTEYTDLTFVTSLNSNGFTAGTSAGLNASAVTYVAWQWQAGQGSTSSNTNGTITSTVSVNTTAGFSVAIGTTLAAGTLSIGHGLGVSPAMVIYKSRNTAGQNWWVWHKSLPNAATGRGMQLNTTSGEINGAYFGTPSVSSTVVTVAAAALNSDAFVLYSWAEISGFSNFGSYTGNGSADGPFVFTGFRPKFVMLKGTGASGANWNIFDTSRDTYNVEGQFIAANTAGMEGTSATLDGLSNGFKIRTSGAYANTSAESFIYMAFAESPFSSNNRAR